MKLPTLSYRTGDRNSQLDTAKDADEDRRPMILTVTPNTALDHVMVVHRYVPGERLSVVKQAECIGGKGNVVSAFIADFGARSVSLGLAAGKNGHRLAQLLRQRGVRADFTWSEGESRRVIVIVEEDSPDQTLLLPATLSVKRATERDLEKRVAYWLPRSSYLALCGSLPPGCSAELYARLSGQARRSRVPVLIDAHGPALAHALKTQPDVVKLNRAELEKTFGQQISGTPALATALRRLVAEGVGLAVCTLGSQGAEAVSAAGAWQVLPPEVKPRSSTGSGDAFTAALLKWREDGAEWPEALRWAAAAGAAKALGARTDWLDLRTMRSLVKRVTVKNL